MREGKSEEEREKRRDREPPRARSASGIGAVTRARTRGAVLPGRRARPGRRGVVNKAAAGPAAPRRAAPSRIVSGRVGSGRRGSGPVRSAAVVVPQRHGRGITRCYVRASSSDSGQTSNNT